MALKFTLAEMSATLSQAQTLTQRYAQAIADLDAAEKALADGWVSTEVGTYEEFVSRYNEKRHILVEAAEHMNRFCQKLSEKMNEFQETANAIKSSFV